MTITQAFDFKVEGVDYTENVSTSSLSSNVGRMFDVFIVKMDYEPERGQSVSATIGDTTFSGLVHSVEKVSKNTYEVVCRSLGAMLMEPYSEWTEKIEESGTSNLLFYRYALDTGVSIVNTTEDVDFFGGFDRVGDHATAILSVAEITGAEVYPIGNTVYVAPNKPITEEGEYIDDNEIFNFTETLDTNDGGGIGYIEINNGGSKQDSGDVSTNSISSELNKDTGELMIFVSPNGDIDSYAGITAPVSVYVKRSETMNVKEALFLTTNSAIKSISSVTLNGNKITNYTFKDGVSTINFVGEATGSIDIEYTAYAKRAFVKTKVTPDGLFYDYDITYMDKNTYGYGLLNNNDTSMQSVGDSSIVRFDSLAVQSDDNVFYADNPNLGVVVYNNGEIADATVDTEPSNDVFKESITYVDTDDYENVFYPSFPYSEILGVEGNNGGYTTATIGGTPVIIFDSPTPGAEISYRMDATKYTVDSSPEDGDYVKIVVRDGDESVEFAYTYESQSDFVCEFPMSIPVDVAEELGVSVNSTVGKTLSVVNSVGSPYPSVTADIFGKVTLNVTSDGRYKIDTSDIITGSYIVVVVDTEDMQW